MQGTSRATRINASRIKKTGLRAAWVTPFVTERTELGPRVHGAKQVCAVRPRRFLRLPSLLHPRAPGIIPFASSRPPCSSTSRIIQVEIFRPRAAFLEFVAGASYAGDFSSEGASFWV